ncbi:MAG: hypothetical protein IPM42_21370 [Saprospiraceae bacterium]|nr:hypothetical protein [Saprospiraceae bacterium]
MNKQILEVLIKEFNKTWELQDLVQKEFWSYQNSKNTNADKFYSVKEKFLKTFDRLKNDIIEEGTEYHAHLEWCNDDSRITEPFVIIAEKNQIGLKQRQASIYRDRY